MDANNFTCDIEEESFDYVNQKNKVINGKCLKVIKEEEETN